MGEVGVDVRDDDPQRGEEVGRQKTEQDESAAGGLEVPQFTGSRHAHLEQEQAKRALKRRDEQGVGVVSDFVSLQPADEPDDDAAEEQTQARIEEDLPQQLAGEDALL